MQKTIIAILGAVLVVGLIVYLMTASTEPAPTTDTPLTNTATTTTQKPAEAVKVNMVELAENTSGNTAKITRATLTKPGYIAIYRTDIAGEVTLIGNTKLLPAGDHANALIQLDPDVNLKDVIVAVIHEEHENETFDFPDDDFPLIVNNAHIMSVDVIGVPHAEEDVRLAARVEAFLKAQAEAKAKTDAEAKNILEVTVNAENYTFSPATITAKQGQTVRVIFVNKGGLHDFVIDEFVGAQTKQIQGNNTETIEFVVDKKGSFKYYCSVGQHRAMGMEGTLTVE